FKLKITIITFSLSLFLFLSCSPHFYFPLLLFSPIFGDVGGILCRLCNLSMPFHGCLLDFGTCRTKPGQYCMKQIHLRGGIQWYSVSGCTETQDDCFKKRTLSSGMSATYCCRRPLCNF
ncbi:uncharacterized protein C9orf57 homolog, partial [Meles meles]|uniref:uncharacterized protein C9orf57 homolog n=1 Tax=Meles meles TaxID=9662 RepID=UPI001E69A9A2